jgi:formylglycine-generating enzyme required for sulfatase activity
MKQNYKIYLCALLLVGAASMTPAAAAKLAVLVVGLETDAASDAFAKGIRYEFTQKGYEVVTTTAVAAKLKELRDKHAEGKPVDTVGLAAWGKTNSIDFVQLVIEKDCDITIEGVTKSGREQLSQVVSCSAEKYTNRPTYRTQFLPSGPNPDLWTEFEEMVFVAGGVFELGPSYYVQLSDFYIGKYAVTQALWKAVMGSIPSNLSSGSSYFVENKPVVYVSWNAITDTINGFLKKLNERTGKNYRLPTEAEWEYAARGCKAGICDSFEYSGSSDLNTVGWYSDNSSTLHVVGQKLANGQGLYDMSGNVWEWCYDRTSYGTNTSSTPAVNPTGPANDSYRAYRGGSWSHAASRNSVTFRNAYPPSTYYGDSGFRLVLPSLR